MDITFPNYNNCTLNIISSILKHFNSDCHYVTIDELDKALAKNYKNIVLMVFDGMGMDTLSGNLDESSYLRKKVSKTVKSVYPSTTTAAMTSYYTGLSPNEHGWLGWTLYFKEYGRIIDAFTNMDSITKDYLGEMHAADKIMPYETVYEKISRASGGKIRTYTVVPCGIAFPEYPNINVKVDSLDRLFEQVDSFCRIDGKKFVMSYWFEPDTSMHTHGCYSEEAKIQLESINAFTEQLCSGLSDTLVIISADHGHINIDRDIFLNDFPELDECLIMPPSMEARAVSLFVKQEMRAVFKERFEALLGDCFKLFTKEEAMKTNLFGHGVQHKKVSDFVGDYLACATGSAMLRYKTINGVDKPQYKGLHAGLTAAEMLVPLILIETK